MPGVRRQARRVALQALFELDSVGHEPLPTLSRLLKEGSLPEEAGQFAGELVGGVVQNKREIDELLRRYAPTWPVYQLAPVDRNILRLAIYEILFNRKVPIKAAINEAVELAKAFGSDNSAKFVNGVLGALVRGQQDAKIGTLEPKPDTKRG